MATAHPQPLRTFEPNIVSNPLTHFGIWTPQGWRTHAKRWDAARRSTICLSGDGRTSVFAGVLRNQETGRVEWSDDLHLANDPFTDGGIYPCDPRVEYPAGVPRWAVSHTLLCYPTADHGLYTHEYTWDATSGDLTTHFRERVVKPGMTDAVDGLTVRVSGPISTAIEGNVAYGSPCSAVRGVWASPTRLGQNLYTARETQVLRLENAVYGKIRNGPVTNVLGIYALDKPMADGDIDRASIGHQLQIAFDLPKLGMIRPPYRKVWSDCYQSLVSLPDATHAIIDERFIDSIRSRRGATFVPGRVGFGVDGAVGQDAAGYAGYDAACDLNSDGVIDERDVELAAGHLGRTVRFNHYLGAYFGGDWLSTGCLVSTDHRPGIPVIVDYERGAGYDAAGTVRLLHSPGPNVPVWVEYFRDVPAAKGTDNIVVHLYDER